MLVKECMTRTVELADPEMTLREAAQKMSDGDFGALPVGENDRLVGIVTDRDIVVRAIAAGKDPSQTNIREIMTKGTLYCYEDQSLDEVTHNMGENQVRRLPVLNRQKRLVGILSLGDVATTEPREVNDALSRISQNSGGFRHPEYRM